MPADDVSDLRDVVDAINRLCDTMKTSDSGDGADESELLVCDDAEPDVVVESEPELVSPERIVVCEVETYVAELWSDASSHQLDSGAESPPPFHSVSEVALDANVITNKSDVCLASNQSTVVETIEPTTSILSPSREVIIDTVALDAAVNRVETSIPVPERSVARVESAVSVVSESVAFDQEQVTASVEPASEMYYTASSEVSLLSDVEVPDRINEESVEGTDGVSRDDRNGVMAGHVAAMRERFESMTRANTPCPDAMRSVSPALDVYRNITPSPDHLG